LSKYAILTEIYKKKKQVTFGGLESLQWRFAHNQQVVGNEAIGYYYLATTTLDIAGEADVRGWCLANDDCCWQWQHGYQRQWWLS
jgi:hypothetical protein